MGRKYSYWELRPEIWEFMEPLLPKKKVKPKAGGRPPVDPFKVTQGIFYVLSTGIEWKALPSEYCSGSTAHKYFQEWTEAGVFSSLWMHGLIEYDEEKKLKFAGKVSTRQRRSRRLVESVQVRTRPMNQKALSK